MRRLATIGLALACAAGSAGAVRAANAVADSVPCDSTQVVLEPAGAVDMVSAFQRDVRDLVRNRLVGIAEERAASLLRLDAVRFGESDHDSGDLRLSKLIGPRVEMSYVGVVGHASEQRLRLDVRVTERLMLQSESDPQGRAASDLVWRLNRR